MWGRFEWLFVNMASTCRLLVAAALLIVVSLAGKEGSKSSLTLTVDDVKDFKKILKTKTNVLVMFTKSDKPDASSVRVLKEVAEKMKGKATIVFVSCSEAKKLCKKYKVSTKSTSPEFIHYHNGDFNKAYDRKFVFKSIVQFLEDPKGETPWEEDDTAGDVVHVNSPMEFYKIVKKSKIPILVMFYAPWCGYCKRLKPDFAAAATEVKGQAILMAADVDKDEQLQLRVDFNITGFPTIYYFENGEKKFKYGGENSKDGIIKWLKDPQPVAEPEKEAEWSDEESEVAHLTDESFDEFISQHNSVLVMFYAPWCGHCKQMKPGYTQAAAQLKEDNISGQLAALDATKYTVTGQKYSIQGFPTLKYFKDGEFAFDVNERQQDKIVAFMKDPKEPPPPPPEEQNWADMDTDVHHLGEDSFKSVLRKKKHALVMFYAPWCGHCKKAKPEFIAAAAQLKDNPKVAYAAVDCTTHTTICTTHGVSGYPTFKYFNYGKDPENYNGGRQEADFVSFMTELSPSPRAAPDVDDDRAKEKRDAETEKEQPHEEKIKDNDEKIKDNDEKIKDNDDAKDDKNDKKEAPIVSDWDGIEGAADVNVLTDETFDGFILSHESVLVMFYAPWCGHCKRMKPAYAEAASLIRIQGIPFHLAAVDATVQKSLGAKYDVKGYPTLKYFKNGEFKFDYKGKRTADDLIKYAKHPVPPPPPEPEWQDVPSAIHHLTAPDYEVFLKQHSGTLVMFYAPWCGHCKKVKPIYQAAADKWAGKHDRHFAAVDCSKYRDICKQAEVKGYPTFHYFAKNKKLGTFKNERTQEKFLILMENPPHSKDEL